MKRLAVSTRPLTGNRHGSGGSTLLIVVVLLLLASLFVVFALNVGRFKIGLFVASGTVAAVVAVLRSAGDQTGGCSVDTPGGRLRVDVEEHTTVLTGPAVIVARGEIDPGWWQSAESVLSRTGLSNRA